MKLEHKSAFFALLGFGLIYPQNGYAKESIQVIKDAKTAQYVVQSGLLNAIVAKELCSCHFVAGLTIKDCLDRANLPKGGALMISTHADDKNHFISVANSMIAEKTFGKGPVAEAEYDANHPRFGCRLVRGPAER